ncbi:SIR2 family NAD-dependent protein deacylase [Caldisericum exile]|uniref:protein acetyllysine N-acetyltransferase n=1 Tax=Caldisericum exile (strain DSM 21853 / NBRC 104410 / AZM16c01) TaxID=511051 RepID=A0A7U6JG94_CALEA|nr:Sir2 family NAD-dependent protein deacetylase [Caldisericum exile]BAL81409.1 NAD-dependent deacetylase [Caldisericum exile AZM16c01]
MIETVIQVLKNAKSISVLTGAGISVNAGIPDFRGETGIYTRGLYSENVFDIDYFFENPKPFYDFVRVMYPVFEKAKPTLAHKFLADLDHNHSVCIVTQNIDLLHEKAGSKNVIHLHGSVERSHCLKCGKEYSFERLKELVIKSAVPYCESCGGLIKPDIVFFSEPVIDFDKAIECVSASDIFFALGTSLEVYPANSLVQFARGNKILINKKETEMDYLFDIVVHEDLDNFFKELQSKGGIV